MNLRIGIDNCKPGWEIILKQIGVSFTQLLLSDKISPDEYSTIIITESHTSKENEVIEGFLNAGGAVLYSDSAKLDMISHKTRKVSFLISEENSPFSQIGLVDIYSTIKIPISKQIITIDSELNITSINHGVNLILPFNINELILNSNSRRKKFYANRKELPSEIVAEVSKGKLRKIVEISLEYLHHKRDLPFVHLWNQPFSDKNLFIFRLDTDFCSNEDADEMYNICRKHNIRATWFLDTESEDRLRNYAFMEDQEMAIHCDKHYVYNSFEENYNNIQKADEKLKKCGINVTGFAAPFGTWNSSLDEALKKMKLKYSSEFTLDYDDLPFYPFCNNEFSTVLQIQIHPISLGRLRRSHFSEDEMLQYYLELINMKSEIGEPVIIYHHPHHTHFDIINTIFQYVNSNNFVNMNMREFNKWWEERYNLEPEFQYTNNKLSSKFDSEHVFIKISTNDGFTISQKGDIQIDEITQKPHLKPFTKHDLKRIRKFHWRDFLYDHESRKSKNAFK